MLYKAPAQNTRVRKWHCRRLRFMPAVPSIVSGKEGCASVDPHKDKRAIEWIREQDLPREACAVRAPG